MTRPHVGCGHRGEHEQAPVRSSPSRLPEELPASREAPIQPERPPKDLPESSPMKRFAFLRPVRLQRAEPKGVTVAPT
ncbi:MAG: hypothetical protein JWP02_998 [Acidimicrobiales bacterium]|nr:hypothetical protein [Acidimicrobiales bacterium]